MTLGKTFKMFVMKRVLGSCSSHKLIFPDDAERMNANWNQRDHMAPELQEPNCVKRNAAYDWCEFEVTNFLFYRNLDNFFSIRVMEPNSRFF